MNDLILFLTLFLGFLGWGIWEVKKPKRMELDGPIRRYRVRDVLGFKGYLQEKHFEKVYFLKLDWVQWQEALKLKAKVLKAARWAKLYGGAAIVLDNDWREEFLKDIKMFKPRIDHDAADAFSWALLGLNNARRK